MQTLFSFNNFIPIVRELYYTFIFIELFELNYHLTNSKFYLNIIPPSSSGFTTCTVTLVIKTLSLSITMPCSNSMTSPVFVS